MLLSCQPAKTAKLVAIRNWSNCDLGGAGLSIIPTSFPLSNYRPLLRASRRRPLQPRIASSPAPMRRPGSAFPRIGSVATLTTCRSGCRFARRASATTIATKVGCRRLLRRAHPLGLRTHPACPTRQRYQSWKTGRSGAAAPRAEAIRRSRLLTGTFRFSYGRTRGWSAHRVGV